MRLQNRESNRRAVRFFSLVALLFFICHLGCDQPQNFSPLQNQGNTLPATNSRLTTVSLLLDGIASAFTLRITITRDGESVATVDAFNAFAADYAFSSGEVPISFTDDYLLEYDTYLFEYRVYYYDGNEVTADNVSLATLVGSASQTYHVNQNLETVPTVTVNINTATTATASLEFFSESPTFTTYTVYTPINAGDSSGKYSSIGVDSEDVAHISFLYQTSSTKRLYYTYGNTDSWQTPWVLEEDNNSDGTTDNGGEYSSLAIDSQDGVHILYYDSTDVATNSNDGCDARYVYFSAEEIDFPNSELVQNGSSLSAGCTRPTGQYAALALYEKYDQGLQIYSYATYRNVNASADRAMFSSNDTTDGSWNNYSINTLNRHGKYSSIAVDTTGHAHLVYFNQTSSKLAYANCTSFAESTVASCNIDTSIDFASGGSANMTDSNGTIDQNTSIATDRESIPHILYYDYTTGTLNHVYGTEVSGWTNEVIDNGDVGQYSDIEVEADGTLHIVYYDVVNMSLKYKQGRTGDNWSLISATTIDTGSVGKYVSMKLNQSTGKIHISYYDETNQKLKYAISD